MFLTELKEAIPGLPFLASVGYNSRKNYRYRKT